MPHFCISAVRPAFLTRCRIASAVKFKLWARQSEWSSVHENLEVAQPMIQVHHLIPSSWLRHELINQVYVREMVAWLLKDLGKMGAGKAGGQSGTTEHNIIDTGMLIHKKHCWGSRTLQVHPGQDRLLGACLAELNWSTGYNSSFQSHLDSLLNDDIICHAVYLLQIA